MPTISYPDAGALRARLEAHGFTISAALNNLLETAAAGGRKSFERRTSRIFCTDGTSQRRFDPPTNAIDGVLELPLPDLSAVPTAVSYQPRGATATAWAVGDDYDLQPFNALAEGKPYTGLLVYGYRWRPPLAATLRGSIYITGAWGWPALPEDVAEAMVSAGLLAHWSDVTMAETGGLLSWKEGDVSEDYGVERWSALKDAWGKQVDKTVSLYRRVVFG